MAITKYLSNDGLLYFWSLIKNKLTAKQDVISDLTNIRTNASLAVEAKNKADEVASSLKDNYYTKTEVNNKLTSAMHYKGSVATVNDLPTDANVGDFYNVSKTGANYAWTGSEWDETGQVLDLSPYAKTEDLVEITNSEIDTVIAS